MDDDADMADMYLARRAQLAANNAASTTQQRADWETAPSAQQTSGMHTLSSCISNSVGFASIPSLKYSLI